MNINAQSIRTSRRLCTLEESLDNIAFDVVGISETWKDGYGREILQKSGHTMLFSGGKFGRKGVGFIVAKHIVQYLTEFKPVSERSCYIDITINKIRIRLIQAYGPTTSSEDEEYEKFLEELKGQMEDKDGKRRTVIINGDFNAASGSRQHESEPCLGPYGYGTRNHRGQMLVDFCCANGLIIANSFSKQRAGRKWTWRTPNGANLKEYDLCLVRSKKIIKSTYAISKFNFSSDHRMVKVVLNMKNIKTKNYRRPQKLETDWPLYRALIERNEEELRGLSVTLKYQKICELLKNARETATVASAKEPRFSDETLKTFIIRSQLLSKTDARSQIQLVETNKMLRRMVANDIDQKKFQKYEKMVAARKINEKVSTSTMFEILKDNGEVTSNPEEIRRRVKMFYEELYKSSTQVARRNSTVTVKPPEVIESEVNHHLKRMKLSKAPGHDQVTNSMLRNSMPSILPHLQEIFTYIIYEKQIPPALADSITTLIPKKGDLRDVGNYRPISVLPATFKLLTRVILGRIQGTLEEAQPPEQAGFRRSYGTTEHIFNLHILFQKAREYNIQMYMVFIDFKKAYDSVEDATSSVKIHDQTTPVIIRRGVRQGCVLSPLLFNAVLEEVFKELEWEEKQDYGLPIDGKRITNLRYADDVVLIAKDKETMQKMVDELVESMIAEKTRLPRVTRIAWKRKVNWARKVAAPIKKDIVGDWTLVSSTNTEAYLAEKNMGRFHDATFLSYHQSFLVNFRQVTQLHLIGNERNLIYKCD
ncbi:hypothetical protein CAEBREN_02039 [Caenorhabditis brenneri]|uniref:Reverse transcriptase domain-containing protein n=1 Tax=Caenorhabditis brenneri TaxID=135651 RepID=G0NIU7_CAEBE|nr:hypothetical protein CAEBREN_02039 [Caenorhabditis brenneri]